jgi:hypothetical protein
LLGPYAGSAGWMASDAEADLRRAMIVATAACWTLIERLDPDNLDQLGLIVRLQELCEFLEQDLNSFVR